MVILHMYTRKVSCFSKPKGENVGKSLIILPNISISILLNLSFTCVSTVLQKVVAATLKKALSLLHDFLFQEIHVFFSVRDLFAL